MRADLTSNAAPAVTTRPTGGLSAGRRPTGRLPLLALLAVLGAGLLLRLGLAYVVAPGQGLASDLGLFESWATTLARVGPGGFYAAAPSANYPPGYLYVLWPLGLLGGPVGGVLGVSSGEATLLLLKLPAIAADMGVATLLYLAGRRWLGARAGLVAAALYLFAPVTWYDSALWGQVDAVGTLVMLAALLLLAEGWSEPAAALAAFGVLVKPQDAICLVVVIPVLVRRHLLRVGSGPVPRLGRRMRRLDRLLDGLLLDQGPMRLGTSVLCAALAITVPVLPFDLGVYGPAVLADVPLVGQVAGLIGLVATAGGQFGVLTANAYNVWALVGPNPLAVAIGASNGAWTPDSLPLLAGLPAVAIGAALLGSVGLVVAGGLLVRDDRLAIFFGFTLAAFAFYALPTRVHERYLFPFFATGALLAAGVVSRALGYLAVGVANAINIHAVLAAPLEIGSGFGQGRGSLIGPGGPGFLGGSFVNPGGSPPGSGRGFPGFPGGFGTGSGGAGSIHLPLAELARSEPVVVAVALGQTAAFIILLMGWLVLVLRPSMPAWRTSLARPPTRA